MRKYGKLYLSLYRFVTIILIVYFEQVAPVTSTLFRRTREWIFAEGYQNYKTTSQWNVQDVLERILGHFQVHSENYANMDTYIEIKRKILVCISVCACVHVCVF